MSIKPADKPKIRGDLVFRQLDEEWVLYDPSGELLHVLNGSAAVAWLYCSGDMSVAEIVDAVSEAFGNPAPREEIEADVVKTLDEFASKGMLA